MRRHPVGLPAGVRPFAADLADPALGVRLVELSARSPIQSAVFAASAGAHTSEAYEAVYIHGMRQLIAALHQLPTPPKRLVFVSSTSVYGDMGGGDVVEATPTLPDSFAGKGMLAAETLIKESGIPSVALRFGGIYGPGRWRLPESVVSGEARLLPGGGPVSNRIHRDDGAAAIAHVLQLPHPASTYLVVDDAPTAHNEVLEWLAMQAGKTLSWAAEASATSRQLRGNKRCSNALLKASGFRFRYPTFREGYAPFFGRR